MLARTTKTAAELGIDEFVHAALREVRWALAEGEILERPEGRDPVARRVVGAFFNMSEEFTDFQCTTVGCIGGWVGFFIGQRGHLFRVVNEVINNCSEKHRPLYRLYFDYPGSQIANWPRLPDAVTITPSDTVVVTPAQGVEAIDRFLAGWQHPWRIEDCEDAPFVRVG